MIYLSYFTSIIHVHVVLKVVHLFRKISNWTLNSREIFINNKSVSNCGESISVISDFRQKNCVRFHFYSFTPVNNYISLLSFPQFHTCVITENVVSFPRSELDVACDDPRCPPDSVVTLYFATDAKRQDGPVPAPTPAVPHASAHHDPILHWDSYTNLEISDDGE